MADDEPSGPQWTARFPDFGTADSLAPGFREGCKAFIAAMRAAGATVLISSTRRPAERAYLMHFAWRIFRKSINPQNVPRMEGVNIAWAHRKPDGSVDLAASRAAAKAMVVAYDIAFQPALRSRHVEGKAIDMTIKWAGNLMVSNADKTKSPVMEAPRNGFNAALRRVGKTYGAVKHPSDPPHWSTDGK